MNKKEMRRVCFVFGIVGILVCWVLNTRLHWGTFGIVLGFAMLTTEAFGRDETKETTDDNIRQEES